MARKSQTPHFQNYVLEIVHHGYIFLVFLRLYFGSADDELHLWYSLPLKSSTHFHNLKLLFSLLNVSFIVSLAFHYFFKNSQFLNNN